MKIYDNKIFSILGNLFFLFEKIKIRSHDSLTAARLTSISRKIKRNRKLLFAKSYLIIETRDSILKISLLSLSFFGSADSSCWTNK